MLCNGNIGCIIIESSKPSSISYDSSQTLSVPPIPQPSAPYLSHDSPVSYTPYVPPNPTYTPYVPPNPTYTPYVPPNPTYTPYVPPNPTYTPYVPTYTPYVPPNPTYTPYIHPTYTPYVHPTTTNSSVVSPATTNTSNVPATTSISEKNDTRHYVKCYLSRLVKYFKKNVLFFI